MKKALFLAVLALLLLTACQSPPSVETAPPSPTAEANTVTAKTDTLPSSSLPTEEWALAMAEAHDLSNQEVLCAVKGKENYLIRTCTPYESLDAVRADYPDFTAPPEALGEYTWTGVIHPEIYQGDFGPYDYVKFRQVSLDEIDPGEIIPPEGSMFYDHYQLIYRDPEYKCIGLTVMDTEFKDLYSSHYISEEAQTITLSTGDVVIQNWLIADATEPYDELVYDNPETGCTIFITDYNRATSGVDLTELFITYADDLKVLTSIH